MKITSAAIQMPSEIGKVAENLERADGLLRRAASSGVSLAVLPEMAISGYGLISDYSPLAETVEGPSLTHLRSRCREWGMTIACGFVERDGHDLYDSLALCLPDGQTHVYRKRNLVFWERFRFRPGSQSPIVATPFGRIGMAICADMIYKRVWDDYRGRIDLAIVSAAWPEFACRRRLKSHWLFGHVGPLSEAIPARVAADLGIPVVFANQVGRTQTTIPLFGTWITEKLSDQFAGKSCIADGLHGVPAIAGVEEEVLISEVTLHPSRGPHLWHSTSRSDTAVSSSGLARFGSESRPDGSIAAPIVCES